MKKKRIAVIGSTGSVGTQALDVIRNFPDRYEVATLTCHSNIDLLAQQANEFKPQVVAISNPHILDKAKALLPSGVRLICDADAHAKALDESNADTSLISVVGFSGLAPLIRSLQNNMVTCVANKESIICGGAAVQNLRKQTGAQLIPVDSEHSAIFQCLQTGHHNEIERILLTCSGGPFRTWPKEELMNATVEQALKHPKWSMGHKITIDSASLANKGLEVMEARWLFDVSIEKVQVVVHPQSIVHSAVEWSDGSVIAQLSVPDMRLAVQYAFGYPERIGRTIDRMNMYAMEPLTFEEPDIEKFPCLRLAIEAGRMEGNAPIVYNAANDMAVDAFMQKRINFGRIPMVIEQALDSLANSAAVPLDDIAAVDQQVRIYINERGLLA